MSTNLYGIRVLDVAPDELRARLRIFVVYYDTHDRSNAPLPDDPSFFLQILWEAARNQPSTSRHPLRMVGTDEICDPEWVAANSHRYVRRIQRVALRNHPMADDGWVRLRDFYYERDGKWHHEDLLVQADYDVKVTDPRWLESLSPGDRWATPSYPMISDQVLADDAPTVLDLREPAMTLDLFPGEATDDGTPSDLVFSDDGQYLAVTRLASWWCCVLAIGACTSASGTVPCGARTSSGCPAPTRSPSVSSKAAARRTTTLRPVPTMSTPVPRWMSSRNRGKPRSPTGRYRADGGFGGYTGYGAWVDVLSSPGESRRLHLPRGEVHVGSVSFTSAETQMFVGQGDDVHVLDMDSGSVVDTITGIGCDAIVRPDGAYLAAAGDGQRPFGGEWIDLWRVSDGARLMRCRSGGYYLPALGWSPDGSMLAVSVITGYQGYGGEARIYRAGPGL